MFVEFVEISDVLVAMLLMLALRLDSTSVKLPKANTPSISASFKILTVPEVWPRDRSPVEKSP